MADVSISIINHSPHRAPEYQTTGSAGADLQAWLPSPVTLAPMERRLIPTGLHIQLPAGFEAQIRPRSGTAFKRGLTVVNSPGTIDSDYRGEILIPLINLSTESQTVESGDRIAQIIIAKHERAEWQWVDSLEDSARAGGGFGHTGA